MNAARSLDGRPLQRPARQPLRKTLLPYLLIMPCIILVGILLIYPLCDEVYLSLTHWNLLYQRNAVFVGPSTWHKLFNDAEFWGSLWRTVQWTAGTVLVQFIIGLPLAMALNHRTKATGLVTGLVLLPWITPTIVVSYAWVWILDGTTGMLTAMLRDIHLLGATSPLTNPAQALPAITVASGWKGAPFMAITLLAALKSVPAELYEASQIDGAGFIRRHLSITVPALRRTALVSAMLLAIWAFYSFDYAWLMTDKGGPAGSTEILGIYLYRTYLTELNWGYAAQIGSAMFAILAAAVAVYLAVARPDKE
jgi:multiple sugar transport system permease protein